MKPGMLLVLNHKILLNCTSSAQPQTVTGPAIFTPVKKIETGLVQPRLDRDANGTASQPASAWKFKWIRWGSYFLLGLVAIYLNVVLVGWINANQTRERYQLNRQLQLQDRQIQALKVRSLTQEQERTKLVATIASTQLPAAQLAKAVPGVARSSTNATVRLAVVPGDATRAVKQPSASLARAGMRLVSYRASSAGSKAGAGI
jgi:hypothetical protein